VSSNNQIIWFKQFNFLLEFDGVISAGFTEVSGLEYEPNVAEYREGYDSERVRKISDLTKFNNITLKRGIVSLANMGDWFRSTQDGQIVRRDGTIILMDESKKEGVALDIYEWVDL
jgi:phage tail-like protein